MNRATALIAVAISALCGAASAQTGLAGDISIETKPFVSRKSRAEVRAELDAFKKSGVNPWSQSYNPLARFVSSESRAEVTAEFIKNRDAVAALNGEDSCSKYLADLSARQYQASRFADQGIKEVQQ
jgi:hypothetical protein